MVPYSLVLAVLVAVVSFAALVKVFPSESSVARNYNLFQLLLAKRAFGVIHEDADTQNASGTDKCVATRTQCPELDVV